MEAGARDWAGRAASARTERTLRAASEGLRRPRAGSHAGMPPGPLCSSPWCSSSCCSCRCDCRPCRWKSRTRRMVTCWNCSTSFASRKDLIFPERRTHPVYFTFLICSDVSPVSGFTTPCVVLRVTAGRLLVTSSQRHLCVNQLEADNPGPAGPASTHSHSSPAAHHLRLRPRK